MYDSGVRGSLFTDALDGVDIPGRDGSPENRLNKLLNVAGSMVVRLAVVAVEKTQARA